MARRKRIKDELFEEPYRFEFFQAVRLLERIYPDREPITETAEPDKEMVRFSGNPSLRFPPSEIKEIREKGLDEIPEGQAEMMVNFMGMVGIAGVLPTHYSELIVDRARYGDTALHSFMDIFTHRLVSFFYKAWEKYRFPVQYERGNDDFTHYMLDWIGLGTRGIAGNLNLEAERLIPYAGLIHQKPHSSSALEQVISDYYDIPVKIEQFFGQWLQLDSESITRLGVRNTRLGSEAIIGTRVWDQQSKFRIVLGALSFRMFQDFLPIGAAHESLKSIVRLMAGLELDFDAQLVLRKTEVPGCILTTRAMRKPRLGWTSWLKSQPFEEDDDQVVLQVSESFV
ncbi:MAG: type VI secretion system baseplate subunit TssG [Pyrinomonadaceae bacterium]